MHAAAAALLLAVGYSQAAGTGTFSVNTSSPVFVVSDRFLSVTQDAASLGRWGREQSTLWQNAKIRRMAQQLTPAYLRFGGTSQDWTCYDFPGVTKQSPNCTGPTGLEKFLHLNGTVLSGIHDFVKAAGYDFVFGVNLCSLRDANNKWDPSQGFNQMLTYAAEHNISFYGLELGNEPDLKLKHNLPSGITPQAVAEDYATFNTVLKGTSGYEGVKVIGNDVSYRITSYMTEWAQLLSPSTVNIFTWHFYYGCGSKCGAAGVQPWQFHDPKVMDKVIVNFHDANQVKDTYNARGGNAEVWLGETSSTYGGGTINASSSFVAGFLWLDKLGLAARMGHKVVCRQVLAHSNYGMIDYDNNPNADWWTAVLWKRLVGREVLDVAGSTSLGRTLRAYAFCAKSGSGAVVAVVLNTLNESASFSFDGLTGAREDYVMTGGEEGPSSHTTYLNDHELQVDSDGNFANPDALNPKKSDGSTPLVLPPVSYGYAVFPTAGAEACT
eukprot:Hpha_TRINITY_DN34128_c0_g1::TRINITY_DN34128_c0_g1_i1::g.75827::m.75827/K07964/HPSE; heparanase